MYHRRFEGLMSPWNRRRTSCDAVLLHKPPAPSLLEFIDHPLEPASRVIAIDRHISTLLPARARVLFPIAQRLEKHVGRRPSHLATAARGHVCISKQTPLMAGR